MTTVALRSQTTVIDLVAAMIDTLVGELDRDNSTRFNAIWIPVAIIVIGAAAMTIYCTLRGYSGWEWKWTWRGVRARCV